MENKKDNFYNSLEREILRHEATISVNERGIYYIDDELIKRTISLGSIALIVAFDVIVANMEPNVALKRAVTICGIVLTASQIKNIINIVYLVVERITQKREIKCAKQKILKLNEQIEVNM